MIDVERIADGGGWWSLDTGVPHCVLLTDDVAQADVAATGRARSATTRRFPQGTNVDFVQAAAPGVLCVRTYERGVEGRDTGLRHRRHGRGPGGAPRAATRPQRLRGPHAGRYAPRGLRIRCRRGPLHRHPPHGTRTQGLSRDASTPSAHSPTGAASGERASGTTPHATAVRRQTARRSFSGAKPAGGLQEVRRRFCRHSPHAGDGPRRSTGRSPGSAGQNDTKNKRTMTENSSWRAIPPYKSSAIRSGATAVSCCCTATSNPCSCGRISSPALQIGARGDARPCPATASRRSRAPCTRWSGWPT